MLRLTRTLHDELIRHAREAVPAETVGLLGGLLGGLVGGTASTARLAVPLPNIAGAGTDSRAFLADPRAQFLAERRLRAAGLHIIAIYHSHPGGGPALSAADQALAAGWPAALQVVVAVARPAGRPDELRAYRPGHPPSEVPVTMLDG